MSTFSGIELGRRAVVAQQAALDVTGHNIANANTTGYSRQVAEMTATDPYTYPAWITPMSAGQVGTGSVVTDITRLRDEFVDNQIRNENHRSGYWTSIQDTMEVVEGIINEPGDTGLSGVMDDYWKAWQALTESPESEAVRGALMEKSQAVVDTFHHMYQQLTDLGNDLNDQVKVKVDNINNIAVQIRDLNQQIQAATVSGQKPNDLMDKRDLLIEDLSKIVDTDVYNENNNMVTVTVGGTALVSGISNNRLGVIQDENQLYKVVWDLPSKNLNSSLIDAELTDTNYPEVTLSSGELLGILEARGPAQSSNLGKGKFFANDTEGIVPGLITDLNNLALTLIKETNTLHTAGYTLNRDDAHPDGKMGYTFFNDDRLTPGIGIAGDTISADGISDWDQTLAETPNWAEYIELNDKITSDVKNIAAAASPTYTETPSGSGTWVKQSLGDGNQALKIAQIKQKLTMGDNTITMDDFWRSEVSVTGVISENAQTMVSNQEDLILTLDNKRQETCGVSMDEEMTNMIKYQHAYSSAARYLTTVDEALNTLINNMGLVGR